MPGATKTRGKVGVKPAGIKGKSVKKAGGKTTGTNPKRKAPIKSASKVKPKPKPNPKQKTTSSSKAKVVKKVKPNCKPKMSQSEKRRRAKNMERLQEIFIKLSLLAGMGIIAVGCMTALDFLKAID